MPISQPSDSSQSIFVPRVQAFATLIRLFNQTGTLLLLFPALWSLVLASHGWPATDLLIIFVLGSFIMRSAGVIMNDLADRSFDGQIERTRHRPLVSGQLRPKHALSLLAILLTIAAGLLYFLNPLTWLLSTVALLLAGLYPFCKRFLHIPQLMLGVAFGWGGVMAWAAVRDELESGTWLLFAATICWAIVYDTIYAIQDKEDDKKIGVKSSAILFGSYTWLGVGLASFFMLLFLSLAGQVSNLGTEYFLGLMLVAVLVGYQVILLRLEITTELAFKLFKQHCWVGMIILAGLFFGTL
ncbi:MAG: 4-hydroxybenzoate octaprenyltransferase [Nitrospirales bacterium]